MNPVGQTITHMIKNNPLFRFWNSSIGKKIIVALTGAFLVSFLAGHLAGNLLMYIGPDAFNAYAKSLHELGSGVGIWIARFVLLGALVSHVAATICLVMQNKESKIQSYEKETYVQANRGSRWMIWSGLTILFFIIFHILHYTVRIDSKLAELANAGKPYDMVILGFSSLPVCLFYLLAMTCLCAHLSHGVASIFQTLGLRTKKNAKLIEYGSRGFTTVIYLGFISIPISVYFKLIS